MITFRGSKNVLATFIFNRILVLFQNTSLCIITVFLEQVQKQFPQVLIKKKKKKINVFLLLLAFKVTDDNIWLIHLRIACLDQLKSGLGHPAPDTCECCLLRTCGSFGDFT
jgi:hypothetical protein